MELLLVIIAVVALIGIFVCPLKYAKVLNVLMIIGCIYGIMAIYELPAVVTRDVLTTDRWQYGQENNKVLTFSRSVKFVREYHVYPYAIFRDRTLLWVEVD